jgi:hypothetical protein
MSAVKIFCLGKTVSYKNLCIFYVHLTLKMTVFWDVALCSLVEVY